MPCTLREVRHAIQVRQETDDVHIGEHSIDEQLETGLSRMQSLANRSPK